MQIMVAWNYCVFILFSCVSYIAGVVMFSSFFIFGLLPLAGFVAWLTLSKTSADGKLAFAIACIVSGIALFILGFFKASSVGG